MMLILAVACCLLTAANAVVNIQLGTSITSRAEQDYFLPTHIIPLHYDVIVNPTFEDAATMPFFTGSSVMTFTVNVTGKDFVTVNVGDTLQLAQKSISVVTDDNRTVAIVDRLHDKEIQQFTLYLGEELVPGTSYRMTARFTGLITEVGYGMFRGSYQENNETKYYLGTQLRPVYARALFPCLDEPMYKSMFTISVSRSANHRSRSNMNLIYSTQPDRSGRVLDTYAVTPLMSAYLVTIFVFDFASVVSSDTRFIGWAEPEKIRRMEFSQKICPRLTDIAEQYFASHLHVPKMDQIALPQMVVIAMENWGINTYREINVLADNTSPTRQFQTVGRFTGHEVLHHWIGDLVTLEWWDWLWMQEAFAMYFEYYLPNVMDPSWRMMDQFITDLNVEGLQGDNINTPLTSRVVTPAEVTAKFSGLTYTKGPALIRMLNHVMGENNFRSSLRELIETRKFSTMNPTELWRVFQNNAPADADITTMMPSWTEQGSYPVLIAIKDLQQPNLIHLCQHVYEKLQMNSLMTVDDDGIVWSMPLTFTTSKEGNFADTQTRHWLNTKKESLTIENYDPTHDWFIFNIQFIGYFRIMYDEHNLGMLAHQLCVDHEKIHPLNRAQLIDDTFSFAGSKVLPYATAFQLISYLPKETEYVPWRVSFRAFRGLDARLMMSHLGLQFTKFAHDMICNIYAHIGFDGNRRDEPLTNLNREQVVEWACYYNVDDCRLKAVETFHNYTKGVTEILPQDVQATVRCYAAKEGTSEMRDFLLNVIMTSTDLLKIAEARSALACSPPSYLEDLLNHLHDAEWRQLFTAIVAREEHSFFALNYVLQNFDMLFTRFGPDGMMNFFTQLQSKVSLFGMNDLVLSHLSGANQQNVMMVKPSVDSLLAQLDKNSAWLAERQTDIEIWLNGFCGVGGETAPMAISMQCSVS